MSPSVTVERRAHTAKYNPDGRIVGLYFLREKTDRALSALRDGRHGPRLTAEKLRSYGVPIQRALDLIGTELSRKEARG